MVSVYTLTRVGEREIEGRNRKVIFDINVTDYENPGGVVLTLAELQVSRLIDLKVDATENEYFARWDASLTAPTLIFSRQDGTTGEFAELPDQTDAGTLRLTVTGR